MDMNTNKSKELKKIALYIVLFFIVWTIYRVGIYTYINKNFSENTQIFLGFLFKISVFTLPVFLYLKYYDNENPLSYLKLNDNIKQGLIGALILSLIFLVYEIVLTGILGPGLKLDFNLSMDYWINFVIFIGFTEEIFFRGFLLKKLWYHISFRKALVISSSLFVLMHYPLWFVEDMPIYTGILGVSIVTNSIYVFGFSVLQSYIFKKTDSLWACIISHSFHNLIVNIL